MKKKETNWKKNNSNDERCNGATILQPMSISFANNQVIDLKIQFNEQVNKMNGLDHRI